MRELRLRPLTSECSRFSHFYQNAEERIFVNDWSCSAILRQQTVFEGCRVLMADELLEIAAKEEELQSRPPAQSATSSSSSSSSSSFVSLSSTPPEQTVAHAHVRIEYTPDPRHDLEMLVKLVFSQVECLAFESILSQQSETKRLALWKANLSIEPWKELIEAARSSSRKDYYENFIKVFNNSTVTKWLPHAIMSRSNATT